MTNFEITGSIPVPPRKRRARGPKYPLAAMRVGDSFFAPGVKITSLYAPTRKASKELGWEFTTRRTLEHGVIGVRVWRIK